MTGVLELKLGVEVRSGCAVALSITEYVVEVTGSFGVIRGDFLSNWRGSCTGLTATRQA